MADLAGIRQRVRQIVAEVAKIGASLSVRKKITIRKRTASSVFVRLKGNKSRPNDSVGRATASRASRDVWGAFVTVGQKTRGQWPLRLAS